MVSIAVALLLCQVELPPEARLTPEPAPPQISVLNRSLLATGGGVVAGGAALGIAFVLVGQNANFDITFAAAGLSALMISGVAFTIHEVLGGRGEVTLGFLLGAAVMAGATAIAYAIDQRREVTPLLAVGIGAIPAAAAAVLGLEGTSPQAHTKPGVQITPGLNGFSGTF